VAAFICYICVVFVKSAAGYDDALDVVGVHGVGGATGCILGGLFNSKAMGAAADGLFYGGGFGLMGAQITMVLSVAAYTGIGTWIILKIIDVIIGIRVTGDEEQEGLDVSQHGEKAYHV